MKVLDGSLRNIFIITILAATLTGLVLAVTDTFTASATVGNEAPIVYVDTGQSLTGQAGQTASVYVFFNATDSNGAGDLNLSSARVSINLSGVVRNSTTCVVNNSIDSNTNRYNCTIPLAYFDEPGTWSINASIADNSSASYFNTTETLTVNNLDAVTVDSASISFSGSPGTNDIASVPAPQRLNNTGNQDYSSLNLTGFDLADGANLLGATNITFNVSNSGGTGQTLLNNTELVITGASLSRGNGTSQDIYFWLDIPSGQPAGTYNQVSNWILEAII